jgi:glutamate racemase
MRLVVTDSGLGGLAVCADLLKVATGPKEQGTELLYVNAAPDPQRSYNSMESLAEKQEVFQTFLHRLTDSYQPDHIFVACHTLSALLSEIKLPKLPIQGMIELTRRAVLKQAKEFGYSRLLVLATPTTISSKVYDQLLPGMQSIACPGLADAISSDLNRTRIIEKIQLFLSNANPTLARGKMIVVLGCTHYGWRENLFVDALDEIGIEPCLINPNRIAAQQLAKQWSSSNPIRFIGAYSTPVEERKTLRHLLADVGAFSLIAALDQEEVFSIF